MSSTRVLMRRLLPAAVSVAILAALFSRLDLAEAWARAREADLRLWLPMLVVYGLGCVLLDGLALQTVLPVDRSPTLWQAGRLRAATYPLAILHYALGSLGLLALLRRRVGVRTLEAAGIVALLAVADLAVLLVGAALGAAFLATRPPPVDRAVFVGFLGVMGTGFVVVRSGGFGPLRRLAQADLFRSLRETSYTRLVRLASVRVAFVGLFLLLGGVTLAAFGIHVPPGDLVVCFAATALVSALPIALSGLGTSQAAMIFLFRHWAGPEQVLAASLTLSAGIVAVRGAVGLFFAREYALDAYAEARQREEEV